MEEDIRGEGWKRRNKERWFMDVRKWRKESDDSKLKEDWSGEDGDEKLKKGI